MSPATEAARGARARPRALTELAEQTGVGDVLVRSLIRAQLTLALRLLEEFGSVLGGLPAFFALAPGVARIGVVGLPLP